MMPDEVTETVVNDIIIAFYGDNLFKKNLT